MVKALDNNVLEDLEKQKGRIVEFKGVDEKLPEDKFPVGTIFKLDQPMDGINLVGPIIEVSAKVISRNPTKVQLLDFKVKEE